MCLLRALAGVGGLCLLFSVAGLAVELPRGADSGGPLTDPSHWRRWLPESADAGDVSLPVIAPLPPLTMAAGDPIRQRFMDQAFVQKWASGPASLPWNRLALELIVKYQQNPLRAARVLAHLHAAAHDAIVGLAATSSEEAAQAVAVHAAAAGVLAHFYPRESPGRLEAIGIGALLAVAASAPMLPQTLDFARAAGRRAASEAIRRALDDGGDATWNPADRPPPAPHLWRAAPPLNLANPGEPLAGKWRTWALADGREMQPPPPPPFGGERYWEEAREVLRVARRLSVEQKRVADEWNLDKGSVTPAGVWNRKAMEWVAQRALGTAETARVLAALNVAMADALVACWQANSVGEVADLSEHFAATRAHGDDHGTGDCRWHYDAGFARLQPEKQPAVDCLVAEGLVAAGADGRCPADALFTRIEGQTTDHAGRPRVDQEAVVAGRRWRRWQPLRAQARDAHADQREAITYT